MVKPLICASLTRFEDVAKACTADLVEVRIDILGSRWTEVVNDLRRPWIACNRRADEGGYWKGDEASRIEELVKAVDLGATFVDVELSTDDVGNVVKYFKDRGVKTIISKHIYTHTPDIHSLEVLVTEIIGIGADIWKIATRACSISDNLTLLKLLRRFDVPGIALAMGDLGIISRILSPLVGGFLTYASVSKGAESAPGQLTIDEIRETYTVLGVLN